MNLTTKARRVTTNELECTTCPPQADEWPRTGPCIVFRWPAFAVQRNTIPRRERGPDAHPPASQRPRARSENPAGIGPPEADRSFIRG